MRVVTEMMLSERQRDDWTRNGFFVLNGFVERPITDELLHAAEEMADRVDAGAPIGDAYTVQESALVAPGKPLSAQLSKIFRVHRTEPVFRRFAMNARTLDPIRALLGDNVDCFLSQFIFKLPGALGQPWHQDAFYFPHEGPRGGRPVDRRNRSDDDQRPAVGVAGLAHRAGAPRAPGYA